MRLYFDWCKVHGEGNFVISKNREILPGPEGARICFTFLTTTRDFSEISILLIIIICETLLFTLICFILGELKSTMGGIGALRTGVFMSRVYPVRRLSFFFYYILLRAPYNKVAVLETLSIYIFN